MRRIFWILLSAVCFLPAAVLHAELNIAEFKDMPNAVLYEADIAGGGPPSAADLDRAAAQGVRLVIDLRAPEEGTLEEDGQVLERGMRYVNIPVTAETLGREPAEALAAVLADENNRPALLHCASGNRAGGMWALYQYFGKGVSAEEAFQAGLEKGMHSDSVKQAVQAAMQSSQPQ